MLGTLQHILILQKKRRRRQSYQPPRGDQPQNSVSRTQLGAKSGDHHRGIENDPSHVTSYRMSHCIGYFNLDGRTAPQNAIRREHMCRAPLGDGTAYAVWNRVLVTEWKARPLYVKVRA